MFTEQFPITICNMQLMRIEISPPHRKKSESFVRSLARPGFFSRNGETLHEGRNTIKRFETDGVRMVVKRYGHLSFFNRLIYGFLRKSKAERAYRHAARLRRLGIDTPEEIAFVEIRRRGLLRESYFVSAYSDYLPLQPITELYSQTQEARAILDALSEFLFRLHWAGVLHKDLNIGNILYKEDVRGGYVFQVIDTNRMEFRRTLSVRQRLKNLRRLSIPAPAYLYILDRYAGLIRSDANTVQLKGVVFRLFFEMRQRMKRRVKQMLF